MSYVIVPKEATPEIEQVLLGIYQGESIGWPELLEAAAKSAPTPEAWLHTAPRGTKTVIIEPSGISPEHFRKLNWKPLGLIE